ncbi:isopeptide-forming domain-containing fimbrial protein, partial [Listeria grayi]
MKKGLAIIVTLFVSLQSLLSPISAQAVSANDTTKNNPLTLIPVSTDHQVGAKMEFTLTQTEGMEAIIDVPRDMQYHGVKNAEDKAKVDKLTYDTKKRELHVVWKDKTEDKSIGLYFQADVAANYVFHAQAILEHEKVAMEPLNISIQSKSTTKTKKAGGISLFSGNVNVDIDVAPQTASISSGQDAPFALNFKVTGSQTSYKNADIAVQLPTNANLEQDLTELKIAGVVPTYDRTKQQLLYHFDELASGKAYKVIIKIPTENGTTKNNTELVVKATFTADNYTGTATDDATVKVNAASSLASSKTYAQTIDSAGKTKIDPPSAGDLGVWKIKVNADKKETGLLYFKSGSKIKTVDTLPAGMTYQSDNSGGKYDAATRTITWEFDAPTIADQKAATAGDPLFNKEIEVTVKFNDDIENMQQFTNKVSTSATDVSDQPIVNNASASVYAGISDPNKVPPGGTLVPPNHGGPIDGIGNAGGTFNYNNPDPKVYDTALLTFTITIGANAANSYEKDFDKYEIIYDVDSHLNLEALNFSGWANFKPDWGIPGNGVIPLKPRADIYLTVNGTERKVLSDYAYLGKHLTRSQLGLSKDDKVSQIRFNHTYAPAGLYSPFAYPRFEVEKGYTGKVTNHVHYNVEGYDKKGDKVSWNNDTETNDVNTFTGYRTATIIPVPPDSLPTLKNTVRFDTNNAGEVKSGSNRLTGSLTNDSSSVTALVGPFEEAVLLPKGVTVDPNNPEFQLKNIDDWGAKTDSGTNKEFGSIKIINSDYQGTGRQLIRINWNDDISKIPSGKLLSYSFNIIIAPNAPTKLIPEAYAFVGNTDFNVPSNSGNNITDSTKETDSDDINGDNVTDQQRVKTGNQYYLTRQDQISTFKLVKGDLDTAYSKMGHTSPGGEIAYQLQLTNNGVSPISDMVMMDVLPSVGDLGITDNLARGSQFTPKLTGPILSPLNWEDRVTIQYSTATNPSRADLVANVDYPDTSEKMEDPAGAEAPNWMEATGVMDWSKIHSFKVTLKDNAEFVSGDNITLDFMMKAPENLNKDLTDATKPENSRAAWNSFAYASNNLQVVEPERVGVVVNAEDPDIHKDVAGKQHLDLTNRNQAFDWHVQASFGNTTASWKEASITDEINKVFDISDVQVVDETGKDVTANGTLTKADNKIKFELAKKAGSYSYLAGHTYTMTITTKIKASTTDEELAPFIKDGGIPNQADLHFGDNGDVKHSEIPTVVPPSEDPDIHKDVAGKQHLDLTNRDQAFDWHVQASFGNTTASWKEASITDEINKVFDISDVQVVDETGKDVTANGTLTKAD